VADGCKIINSLAAGDGQQLHAARGNPYHSGVWHCDGPLQFCSEATTIVIDGKENRGSKRHGSAALIDPHDLARFEGEGGLEAPEPVTHGPQKPIDPALGDAIRQRPPCAAHQTNRNHEPKEITNAELGVENDKDFQKTQDLSEEGEDDENISRFVD